MITPNIGKDFAMTRLLNTLCTFFCASVIMCGAQAQAPEDTFPNKVKTHIGELTFDHGIPTEETSEKWPESP